METARAEKFNRVRRIVADADGVEPSTVTGATGISLIARMMIRSSFGISCVGDKVDDILQALD